MFRVDEIRAVEANPSTIPSADLEDIFLRVRIWGEVGDGDPEPEEFTYGLVPEDDSPNAQKVRAAVQEWLDAGNTIPEYVERPTNWDINEERNRRTELGCMINGIYIRGEDKDRENLSNLSQISQLRLSQGDTTTITRYKDGNNVIHDLLPSEVIDLYIGGIAYIDAVYQASWAIKEMDRDWLNHRDDSLWPVSGLEA